MPSDAAIRAADSICSEFLVATEHAVKLSASGKTIAEAIAEIIDREMAPPEPFDDTDGTGPGTLYNERKTNIR